MQNRELPQVFMDGKGEVLQRHDSNSLIVTF